MVHEGWNIYDIKEHFELIARRTLGDQIFARVLEGNRSGQFEPVANGLIVGTSDDGGLYVLAIIGAKPGIVPITVEELNNGVYAVEWYQEEY